MATNNTLARYAIGDHVRFTAGGELLKGRTGRITRNSGVAYHVRLDEDADPERTFQATEKELEPAWANH